MQIADGGGGAIGSAIGQSIFDSMNSFANTAAAGGFEVSAEGGDAMIKAITGFQDWVNSEIRTVDRLAQERMLGTSNGAKVIAPFVRTVATDGQGFATQLKALAKSLEKAKEGIQKAMDNYRATEEANRSKSNNIQV
ncbi:hypothetical protein JOF56_002768 [Kibdelosporangium banguiense]|uniref:Uncharacterized protein n=1 Tax=Kibdelosporangium banguiense TaxID=1365924 RepID=A0ABS4TD78_9PSEU|nr:hypothetical protein [Kibdelosporangium banguiense]MBP2322383.1 hypothetical protein [Kibdelosporangium banguiense]